MDDAPARGRGVLEGAVSVLQALPAANGPGQVAQLASATGIPYATVHRVLGQLVELGLVTRSGGRYGLGAGVLDLARHVEPIPRLRARAAAVMSSLREHTGATVSLVSVLDGRAVVLDLARGREGLPYPVSSGHRLRPGAAGALVLTLSGAASGGRRAPLLRRVIVHEDEDLPGLSCYAVALSLPGRAQAALQLSTSGGRPATRFASVVDQAAERISAGLRGS